MYDAHQYFCINIHLVLSNCQTHVHCWLLIQPWTCGPLSHGKWRNSSKKERTQIVKFMGPTWGPPGSCWPQMGPMLAPWTLRLSGKPTMDVGYILVLAEGWEWVARLSYIKYKIDFERICYLIFCIILPFHLQNPGGGGGGEVCGWVGVAWWLGY